MTEVVPMRTKDFFIIGPAMQPDNGVLEAIYSLLYLPLNYKLMLPTVASSEDMTFREEINAAIEKNALRERVHFVKQGSSAGSPEAFASAALKMSRTAH